MGSSIFGELMSKPISDMINLMVHVQFLQTLPDIRVRMHVFMGIEVLRVVC